MWKRISFVGGLPRAVIGLALVVVIGLAIAACGSSSDSSSSTGSSDSSSGSTTASETESSSEPASSGSAEGKKVYFLGCGPETPYCAVQNREIEKQLKEKGVDIVVENDGPHDVTIQAKQLNNAVAQDPDMITGVFNVQGPLRPGLLKAQQSEIPVAAFSSQIEEGLEDLFSGHVAANEEEIGQVGGELMLEGLEQAGVKEGRVIILSGTEGDPAAEGRNQGFEEAMAGSPFEVTVAWSNWLPTKAASETQQLLAKYSDIVGFFGTNGAMAAAGVQSAKQAGAKVGGKDGLVFSGGNCDPTALQPVANGEMQGFVAQSPYTDVETQVEFILNYLEKGDLPENTPVPQPKVTKSNLAKYEKVCTF